MGNCIITVYLRASMFRMTPYTATMLTILHAERYRKWVEAGYITVTDGAEIDYRVILEDAKRDNQQTPVEQNPVDPHGATNLSHQLADEQLNPITIIQNYTNMSDPMKSLRPL